MYHRQNNGSGLTTGVGIDTSCHTGLLSEIRTALQRVQGYLHTCARTLWNPKLYINVC
jgi:hypothetical protein